LERNGKEKFTRGLLELIQAFRLLCIKIYRIKKNLISLPLLNALSARKISTDYRISHGWWPPFAEKELAQRECRSPSGQIRPHRAPLAHAPVPSKPFLRAGSCCRVRLASYMRAMVSRVESDQLHRGAQLDPDGHSSVPSSSLAKRSGAEAESWRDAFSRAMSSLSSSSSSSSWTISRAEPHGLFVLSDVTPFSLHPWNRIAAAVVYRRDYAHIHSSVAPSGPNIRDPVDRPRSPATRPRARAASLPLRPIRVDRSRSRFRECVFCARRSPSRGEGRENQWNLWVSWYTRLEQKDFAIGCANRIFRILSRQLIIQFCCKFYACNCFVWKSRDCVIEDRSRKSCGVMFLCKWWASRMNMDLSKISYSAC